MASPSSSNQRQVHNNLSLSRSEADPLQVVDIRKRKRMQSNRESARRSRLRKKKHVDDLTTQVTELKAENCKIFSTTTATTQLYLDIQAENSVLRAQLVELRNRLQSLNDIICCLINKSSSKSSYNNNINTISPKIMMATTSNESDHKQSFGSFDLEFDDCLTMNSRGLSSTNYPIMPTQDAFMC